MPIKQLLRPNRSGNLADVTEERSENLKIAGLFTVDIDGRIQKDIDSSVGKFLLNPSTWNESNSSNWNQKIVPGNSDPILQWTSGGARTVTFQALVTADTSDFISDVAFKPGEQKDKLAENKIFNSSIASAFSKTLPPTPRMPLGNTGKYTNLDISLYLNYYRSLLYPLYTNPKNPQRLEGSPPLVVLFVGSAINRFKMGDTINSLKDVWVVTNLNIKITKQLPNLAPMEAVVDFTLLQYNIKSFDRRRFLGRVYG